MYGMQVTKILRIQKPQLVVLPAIHLKCEIGPHYIPVTFINVLDDQVQLSKHLAVGSLCICHEYHDEQNAPVVEGNQIEIDNKHDLLPYTLQDAKFVCSPVEVETHCSINLQGTPLLLKN